MRGVKSRELDKWKRLAVFFILFLIFGVLVNSVRKVYIKKQNATAALSKMQADIAELKDREETLDRSLKRLATNEGVEYELRKKFSIARVGESVAVIVDELPTASTTSTSLTPWQKLKKWLYAIID